jgi:hypothetical protein
MKFILIFIAASLLSLLVYSQCDNFHNSSFCLPNAREMEDMIISSQSKSGYLEARRKQSFQMTLFGKMDYKILFCANKKFFPIHFVLTEKETGIVIYDNSKDEYIESIGFTTDNTTIIIVDVILLAEGVEFKSARESRTCVGVPILYRKIAKTGF